ncbi:MAG: phosphate ABC transporter substrate-binding protein PstS [cyanobacterium endosymbiont of Rhopalodia musculus]|uniref:phosphate ABC transporter substrate-binding protein PstS n=1 Tax=cyanobacterium endosymbiont of Epithemia clementina EcSB TaxID=3034674 RepID=UPI0024811792|nr:phosphate ABC transporter substrate-binding protein PstS [cyanobacterium endosymbiont of Epithemia clementina EcSB]WGT68007.1 phosphate ABC transporter substrate-binding protein PstS [cyanobacterium endosymbiont of Epithemia clementina EcSB]
MLNFFKLEQRPFRLISSLSMLALIVSLGACSSKTYDDGSIEGTATNINKPPLEGRVTLTGAGASFPAPLYQNWFVQLKSKIPDLQVNYQSIGSGAGVEQFTTGTVDFGASDVAMKDEEIAKVSRGVILLPMTAGSVVVAYNLPGVIGLKLSREAYVGIMQGSITNWSDPKIVEANPDLTLPSQPITVVHRSDGSGTTEVFTKHLSAISSEWETTIGQGKSVEWPTTKGKFIGSKGNEGVTATVQHIEGAIGYIEYGYAKNNGLTMAALENLSGNYIEPSDESAEHTLDAVTLPEDLRVFITDPEGDQSYPIVTYTWMLAYKQYDDPQKAIAMEAMIEHALNYGQETSKELGYVALPPSVKKKVAAAADVISPDYTIELKQTDDFLN